MVKNENPSENLFYLTATEMQIPLENCFFIGFPIPYFRIEQVKMESHDGVFSWTKKKAFMCNKTNDGHASSCRFDSTINFKNRKCSLRHSLSLTFPLSTVHSALSKPIEKKNKIDHFGYISSANRSKRTLRCFFVGLFLNFERCEHGFYVQFFLSFSFNRILAIWTPSAEQMQLGSVLSTAPFSCTFRFYCDAFRFYQ